MTDAFIGWLIIGSLFALWAFFTRKKTPQKPSRLVFIEVVEVVEIFAIRKRSKTPRFLVNLVIVSVVGLFIWAAYH